MSRPEVSIAYRQDFVTVMPDDLRGPDPVQAYRAYLRRDKAYYATWKRREPPQWWHIDA